MKGFYVRKNSLVKLNSKKEKEKMPITFQSIEQKEKKNFLVFASNIKLSPTQQTQINKIKHQAINQLQIADTCDTFYFKDGTVMTVKIIEETEKTIKYIYCTLSNNEAKTTYKWELERIVFSNGSTKKFKSELVPTNPSENKKMNGFALAGFISSIIYYGIALTAITSPGSSVPLVLIIGLIFLILCIIGLTQINRNEEKYKGKALAITGLILLLLLGLIIIGFLII